MSSARTSSLVSIILATSSCAITPPEKELLSYTRPGESFVAPNYTRFSSRLQCLDEELQNRDVQQPRLVLLVGSVPDNTPRGKDGSLVPPDGAPFALNALAKFQSPALTVARYIPAKHSSIKEAVLIQGAITEASKVIQSQRQLHPPFIGIEASDTVINTAVDLWAESLSGEVFASSSTRNVLSVEQMGVDLFVVHKPDITTGSYSRMVTDPVDFAIRETMEEGLTRLLGDLFRARYGLPLSACQDLNHQSVATPATVPMRTELVHLSEVQISGGGKVAIFNITNPNSQQVGPLAIRYSMTTNLNQVTDSGTFAVEAIEPAGSRSIRLDLTPPPLSRFIEFEVGTFEKKMATASARLF